MGPITHWLARPEGQLGISTVPTQPISVVSLKVRCGISTDPTHQIRRFSLHCSSFGAQTPIFRDLVHHSAGSGRENNEFCRIGIYRYIYVYIYINNEVKIKKGSEMGMNGVYRNIGVYN